MKEKRRSGDRGPAKTLKVYGGSYDGRWRLIVAAPTKQAAYAAMKACLGRISYSRWDTYTSITGNDTELEHALGQPGVVFRQAITKGWNQPFERNSP